MSIEDRRKYKRHNVQQGTFVAIPSNCLIGELKNVSMGGVSFSCISLGRQSYSIPELEIFSKDNKFYLKEIPFRVVSEIDVENHVPCSSQQIKQISGEFAELTEYQKSKLDSFLHNLTATEAVC